VSYTYPLGAAGSLVERVSEVPPSAQSRRWVLRDDNQQHCHGVLSLAEDPAYIELHWKAGARGREQLVGLFRLHLARLLAECYVRREHADRADDPEVHLRFRRGDRGVVSVQVRDDQPALPIGVVDATLG
jgi:hypothetical protein